MANKLAMPYLYPGSEQTHMRMYLAVYNKYTSNIARRTLQLYVCLSLACVSQELSRLNPIIESTRTRSAVAA